MAGPALDALRAAMDTYNRGEALPYTISQVSAAALVEPGSSLDAIALIDGAVDIKGMKACSVHEEIRWVLSRQPRGWISSGDMRPRWDAPVVLAAAERDVLERWLAAHP